MFDKKIEQQLALPTISNNIKDHLQCYLLFKKIKISHKPEPMSELKQAQSQRNLVGEKADGESKPIIYASKHYTTTSKKNRLSSSHKTTNPDLVVSEED